MCPNHNIVKLEEGGANPTIGNLGQLFASMWLKLNIAPSLLVPSQSIESAVLKNLSEPEGSFDLSSRFKSRVSAPEPIPNLITRPSSEVFSDLSDKGQLIVGLVLQQCHENVVVI